MSGPEARLQAKCADYWRGHHGGAALKTNPTNSVGFPDFMFLYAGGETIFVEFKTVGRQPTKAQKTWLWRLAKMGHRVYLVDDFEYFKQHVTPTPRTMSGPTGRDAQSAPVRRCQTAARPDSAPRGFRRG